MNVLEAVARQALLRPGAIALVGGDQQVSYGELMANVATVAGQLAARGVGRGDVVAIVAPGLLWHVTLTLATAHLGAVSLALGAQADEADVAIAQACAVKLLVHNQPDGFHLPAPCIQAQTSVRSLASRPAAAAPSMASTDPDDVFRIGLSSGTTGWPKAVRISHGAAIVRTHLTRTHYPSGPGERMVIGLNPTVPFALMYWLRALTCGATVIAGGGVLLETVHRERATFLLTGPMNAVELIKSAQAEPRFAEPPTELRTLCIGGAAVAPELQALLRRHVCANLCLNYGSTEGGQLALADPSLLDSDPASAGRLLPWVEAEAVDEFDRPLPAGQAGRLRVRSPCLALGYVAGTGQEDAFRGGWFYSSDRGRVSADGLVHLRARADVLHVAGGKVDPARIERVIAQDPAILECVAVAVPGELGLAQLVAVVVAPQGVDRAALDRRCRDALGANLVPSDVVVLEQLPHNEAGKVLRQQVAALVERRRAAGAGPAAQADRT